MYMCQWIVLCENVIHDSQTNCLTLVNALTEVRATGLPALHTRFAFAVLLRRDDAARGALSLRLLRITDAGEEVVVNIVGREPPPRVQFYMNFPLGIRLFSLGPVRFRVDVREGDEDWYPVATQELQVIALEGSPLAEQGETTPPDEEAKA